MLFEKKPVKHIYIIWCSHGLFEKLFTKLLTNNNRLRVGLTLGTLPLHDLLWSHTGGVKNFIYSKEQKHLYFKSVIHGLGGVFLTCIHILYGYKITTPGNLKI